MSRPVYHEVPVDIEPQDHAECDCPSCTALPDEVRARAVERAQFCLARNWSLRATCFTTLASLADEGLRGLNTQDSGAAAWNKLPHHAQRAIAELTEDTIAAAFGVYFAEQQYDGKLEQLAGTPDLPHGSDAALRRGYDVCSRAAALLQQDDDLAEALMALLCEWLLERYTLTPRN